LIILNDSKKDLSPGRNKFMSHRIDTNNKPPYPGERSGGIIVEARIQSSNHLEEDLQRLIIFDPGPLGFGQ
jgi:hypothetical protein